MAAAIKQEEALHADALHRQRLMEKRLQEISKVRLLHPATLQKCFAWQEISKVCSRCVQRLCKTAVIGRRSARSTLPVSSCAHSDARTLAGCACCGRNLETALILKGVRAADSGCWM